MKYSSHKIAQKMITIYLPVCFWPLLTNSSLKGLQNTLLYFEQPQLSQLLFCLDLALAWVNGVISRQCSKSLGQTVQSFDLAIWAAPRITATYAARKVHEWRVVAGSGTTDGDRWTFNRQMLQTLPRFNAAHGTSKEFQVRPKQECKMHDTGERDSSLLHFLLRRKLWN